MSHATLFTQYRPLLFTIAYEITGTASDAEDVLQDSYLRWADVELAQVADPKNYLARIVTRQALNALRSGARRREEYVGPWLPEPVRTESPDAAADVLLAESVSMAMLVVLETLSPDERVVFVLREVFGFEYPEIAATVGKTVAAVRQTGHRARNHVQARRRRFAPPSETTTQVCTQFLMSAVSGDLGSLMEVLAPGVTLISDGGGKISAARRPVVGADKVARFLIGVAGRGGTDLRVEFSTYNSMPALVVYQGETIDQVTMFEIDGGAIHAIYLVRNPDKLAGVTAQRELAR